jgi:hypothetical protein
MAGLDTLAVFAFQHWMPGNQLPFLEYPDLMRMVLNLDHTAAGSVGHTTRHAQSGQHGISLPFPMNDLFET